MNRTSRLLLPAAVAGLICQAQTQVNLQTQGKNVDFSQAPSTKPFKVGATLPATCEVGETFFNTSAAAGANWYGCVAANVWAVQSGAGTGSGGITQLTGDVAAGPGSGAQTATIQPGAVTLSKMANLAAGSIICNNTASAATPIACTPAQVNAMLGASGGGGGGGGDPVESNQLTDFVTTKTSGTALTVNPGIYRVGYASYAYAGTTTFTLAQFTVTAVSSASQAVLTTSALPPLGTMHLGDTFYVSGATGTGCSGLNGLQTIVNVPSANTVIINWNSTGCTYAGGATFGANPGATGTGYIYGDNQGNLTLMMPASVGLLLSGTAPSGTPTPITIQSSTPGFGAGSVPIAQITLSSAGNGNWNAVTDARAFMSTTGILAGAGLLANEAGGIWTLGIDPSVVPELGAGNTWTGANDFSAANSTSPLKVSASAPATCSVGQYYFNSANSHTYACTASNTWSQVDGGGSGGGGGGGAVATTTTETIDLPVGTCDYGGAGHTLWWSTSYTSAAGCFSIETASAVPIIVFGASGTATGRPHLIVPFGWASGTVNLYLYGYNGAGGSSASTYSVQTQCYSPSNGYMPAFPGAYNTAQTLTTTPQSNGPFITQLSNLTMTGCSAGSILDILLTKTSTNAADLIFGVYLTIVRNL
ncbi:MAG TPA: hypothetical protein VIY49_33890 [Bryobacteraceae bacterium]